MYAQVLLSVHLRVHIYACVCKYVLACACVNLMCIHLCVCACVYIGVCVDVWVCVHMSVCVCTCGFVHTYSSFSLHFLSFEAPVDARESKELSGFAPEFRAILLAAHLPEPQSPYLLCTPALCVVTEIVMYP